MTLCSTIVLFCSYFVRKEYTRCGSSHPHCIRPSPIDTTKPRSDWSRIPFLVPVLMWTEGARSQGRCDLACLACARPPLMLTHARR